MDDIINHLLKEARVDFAWKLVEVYSKQPRCFPDDVQYAAEKLVVHLKELGLSPTVNNPELYLGIPLKAQIHIDGQVIEAKAGALSPSINLKSTQLFYLPARQVDQRIHSSNPDDHFERQFSSDDEAMKQVKGKIIVTEGLSNPARTQILERWGAVGVIVINPGEKSHWGANSTVWGSPAKNQLKQLPKIASIAVPVGMKKELLRAESEHRPVDFIVEMRNGWFKQPVVSVEIRGYEKTEDYILLHGHYDSWDVGVGDNATGNGLMLEIARLFGKHEGNFRRSLRIIWWPGHSAGRYAGSTWYADHFAIDLLRNCIAHVNCDSPGCRGATSYESIRGMSEFSLLIKEAVNDLFNQKCKIGRVGRSGDYSFNNIGISGCMLTSSMTPQLERQRNGWYSVGGCGGSPVWHTEDDVMRIADEDVLFNDIRLYAFIIGRLVNDRVLPIDLRTSLEDNKDYIFKKLNLIKKPFKVEEILECISLLERRLDDLYRTKEKNPEVFNQKIKYLSRYIVRIGYAEGDIFDQDPARFLPQTPLIPDQLDNNKSAAILIQRNLNRLHYNLIQAIQLVDS